MRTPTRCLASRSSLRNSATPISRWTWPRSRARRTARTRRSTRSTPAGSSQAEISRSRSTPRRNDYLRKSQDSLRVLAEDTGGLAVVNKNDFDKALKRIDAESSDYYVLGYYSGNPDPTRRRRQLAIKVTRAKLTVTSQRTEYVLKQPPRP